MTERLKIKIVGKGSYNFWGFVSFIKLYYLCAVIKNIIGMDTRLISLMCEEHKSGIPKDVVQQRAIAREREVYETAKSVLPCLATQETPDDAARDAYRSAELLYWRHRENKCKIMEVELQ